MVMTMTSTAIAVNDPDDNDGQRAETVGWARVHQLHTEQETVGDVQAATEGVQLDDSNSVELNGRRFKLAQSIGLMPLLKFAHAAKSGLTSDDMEGMSAMYTLLRCCIDRSQVQAVDGEGKPVFDDDGNPVWAGPSQWMLFEEHTIDTAADGEALSKVINQAIEAISSRPTSRPGGSSPSSGATSASSKGSSSSQGTPRVPPGFEGLTVVADLGRPAP